MERTRGRGAWIRAGWAGCGATTLKKVCGERTSRWRLLRRSHACVTMEEFVVVACVRRWGKDRMLAAVGKEMSLAFCSFWRNMMVERSKPIAPITAHA
jgi:hypothetical protein